MSNYYSKQHAERKAARGLKRYNVTVCRVVTVTATATIDATSEEAAWDATPERVFNNAWDVAEEHRSYKTIAVSEVKT